MNYHTDPKVFANIHPNVLVTIYHPKEPNLAVALTTNGYTVFIDAFVCEPFVTHMPRWKTNLEGWLRCYTA